MRAFSVIFTLLFGIFAPAVAWAAPVYTASPSAKVATVSCEELRVVSENNGKAPQTVEFAVDVEGEVEKVRYLFGDGKSAEGGSSINHEYLQGGSYEVRAEVKERDGDWVRSDACKTEVKLETVSVVPHRSECTDLRILSGNEQTAPAEVVFEVTGFDNKEEVQGYIVNYGDGEQVEQEENTFKHTYEEPGSYSVQGFIVDSKGERQGGTPVCSERVRVKTKVMKEQPDTGIESVVAAVLMASLGLGGVVLMADAKARR